MLYAIAYGHTDITLRLQPTFYDESRHQLYVDVEVKYEGSGRFMLADQNYRLFFDSKTLRLVAEHSHSDLPQDLYGPLTFFEIADGLQAGDINQLDFDDDLGFVNFSIDLLNTQSGGLSITSKDDWQRVAVLNFTVDDPASLSQIIWSRAGRTDQYATAFVEIMEWKGPQHTEPASVNDMIDATFFHHIEGEKFDIAIAPNPATEFIKVSFDQNLTADHQISIIDPTGKTIKALQAYKGSKDAFIPIADLIPGSYILEVRHADRKANGNRSSFIKS